MYKLKNSLLAFAGQSLLVGAIALVTPHATLGQGGDAVGPTRPVTVVNTPAEPVPVTRTITGSVSITNTPRVTVANTPSVNVANAPIVRFDPGANGLTGVYEVPGTTLIIDVVTDGERTYRLFVFAN